MIGAASIGAYYHGFEPSKQTYEGLIKLGNFLKSFQNGFNFKIENIPFEDSKLNDNYDFALTSPPYYDTEIYSDELTNSCNRYKTFEEWVIKFYIPMIQQTLKYSKYFVLNIGSRTYNLKKILLDNFTSIKEIESRLSGSGGLGRENDGKETFYLIKGGIT